MNHFRQHCLLLGAGTAHLAFLKKLKMSTLPELQFTLVSESSSVFYSGMFPGFVSGRYQESEVKIDLVKFCGSLGVELIIDKVVNIDPRSGVIFLETRKELGFEWLSINLGLNSRFQNSDYSHLVKVRPLTEFAYSLSKFKNKNLGIIGGGMSACEMALALRQRYQDKIKLSLIFSEKVLLEKRNLRLSKIVIQALNEAGVNLHPLKRVEKITAEGVETETGEVLEYDFLIDLSSGVLPSCLQYSLFSLGVNGGLKTRRTLQLSDYEHIFGVGDCISFDDFPELTKNGVHAVRQASILYENLRRKQSHHSLIEYQPQRNTLALMSLSNEKTVLDYSRLSHCSTKWSKWKDSIDRKWMRDFQESMDRESDNSMLCGGCGSKVNQTLLDEVLGEVGISSAKREDAAELRSFPKDVGEELKLQTVDVLREMPVDAFLYGKVAALHCLSDIYAMNAVPETALSIVCMEEGSENWMKSQFSQMMRGAQAVFSESNVELIGGHSYLGKEHGLGFSITGTARRTKLFLKNNLRVGDHLYLTRKIGSGVLLRALQMGKLGAESYHELLGSLTQLRIEEHHYLQGLNVRAATDVTGFGLINHLYEMLESSGVSANLHLPEIKIFSESTQLFDQGVRPSAYLGNKARALKNISGFKNLNEAQIWPLFDPQTCGPFLFGAVKGTVVDEKMAWKIGEVVPSLNTHLISLWI